MVTPTAFSVPTGTIDYWQKRLNLQNIKTKETQRFANRAILVEDPYGLHLELITTPSDRPISIWQAALYHQITVSLDFIPRPVSCLP
jgi:glyoxalase family protein